MSHALLGLAALAYCAAGVAYLWYLIRADPPAARLGFWGLAAGLVLHGTAIALKIAGHDFVPAINVREGLSLLAWLMGCTYLILDQKLRLPILGAFVLPLVLLIALPALAVPIPDRPLPRALGAGLLPFHILTAFLGYALFAVASGVGSCYLLQERELKGKAHLSTLWSKLPSLEVLDHLGNRLVLWGFALFTFAIVTGALVAKGTWGSVWSWEPNEALALATWVLFAGVIQARQIFGWQGRRAAVLTMLGFLLAMGSFLGLSLCPVDRHGGSFQ
ncbi:MAG TPA: cytochrome c biogenesis protein CcsA [Myxococcales bacterium]|nr:cytochrome c biogenesis protein CcsA [Myxococcales bacterium]